MGGHLGNQRRGAYRKAFPGIKLYIIPPLDPGQAYNRGGLSQSLIHLHDKICAAGHHERAFSLLRKYEQRVIQPLRRKIFESWQCHLFAPRFFLFFIFSEAKEMASTIW